MGKEEGGVIMIIIRIVLKERFGCLNRPCLGFTCGSTHSDFWAGINPRLEAGIP